MEGTRGNISLRRGNGKSWSRGNWEIGESGNRRIEESGNQGIEESGSREKLGDPGTRGVGEVREGGLDLRNTGNSGTRGIAEYVELGMPEIGRKLGEHGEMGNTRSRGLEDSRCTKIG